MIINVPFETQSLFCSILTEYFAPKNINVYYSIPLRTKAPYIKIISIDIKKQQLLNPDYTTIIFGLHIEIDSTNNEQIMQILQNLETDACTILQNQTNQKITITNAIIGDSSIYENIDKKTWLSTTSIAIISQINNNI